MLLSIIIPAYNDGKYLKKSLQSVYQQSFQDFEVIIINDGSTDKTEAHCNRWKKLHGNIHLINQENQGSSVARRNGILAANGKYCIFLDADDWFCDDNALERLVQRMEESGVDVLQFLVEKNYFGKGKPVSGSEGEKSYAEFWEKDCSTLLGGKTWEISPYLCDKIYRTEPFQKAVSENEVERIFIFDYIYLNLLYFSQKEVQRIAYVPWVLYSWRQYSGGIFQCDETLMEDYEVLKPLELKMIEKQGLSEAFRKQCHVETAYLFGSACSKAAQHQKVTVSLLKKMYQYATVQGAIIYFTEHPSGLWDVIWDFMNTDEDKLTRDAIRYNKSWKGKIKNLFICLFCGR